MRKSSPIFLAISGNIGAGKTTLTERLAKRFNFVPRYEPVDNNPYLSDFYLDMARWSFPLQIFFLNHRLQVHRQIVNGSMSSIQDRSIYEDANIFARNLFEQGNLEKRDYENYLALYNSVCEGLPAPSLMIYLRKNIPNLTRQIAARGRAFEKGISVEYLTQLNCYYDEWMAQYNRGPKLIVESDNSDFLNDNDDFEGLVENILTHLDQKDFLLDRPDLR